MQTALAAPQIPAGMVAVSWDEFFARLKADPRDIMPSVRHSEFTTWETAQREVWGWSFPGWKNSTQEPKIYAVKNA